MAACRVTYNTQARSVGRQQMSRAAMVAAAMSICHQTIAMGQLKCTFDGPSAHRDDFASPVGRWHFNNQTGVLCHAVLREGSQRASISSVPLRIALVVFLAIVDRWFCRLRR